MPGLRELQQQFAAHLNKNDATVIDAIETYVFDNAKRMQIYRNNTVFNFRSALESTYPALKNLVGEAYFVQLSKKYATEYPSLSGDIQQYGIHFASMLQTVPEARQYPWFHDLAALEWAYHQSFHAEDAKTLSLQALGAVDAADYGRICLTLHPSCQLIASTFPLLDLWRQGIAPDVDIEIAFDDQINYFMVHRQELTTQIQKLTDVEFMFFGLVEQSLSLQEILPRLTDKFDDFDLMALLAKWLPEGVLSALFLKN